MNSLKERILRLQETSESLEPTKDQRDSYIESVKGFAHKFISSLNDVETFNSKVVNKDALSLSNSKRTLDEIIKTFNQEVAEKGMKPASGGHLGYIPGGGIYAASLGDFLADITNEYTGMYYASPGGVTIENELIDWMKELFEFPKSSVGNLTSGGSIANLIALTAARDKHGIKNAVIEKSVIYTSPQIHHCVHKALRIIGLEDVQIRYVELDENSRIVPEDLERKIEADKTKGLNPFVIIASAGTTDTGAIDPLEEIGDISKKHGGPRFLSVGSMMKFLSSGRVLNSFLGPVGMLCCLVCFNRFSLTDLIIFCWKEIRAFSMAGLAFGGVKPLGL